MHVQEAEMRENDKKITEQKRKLDDLSMVLEKNVCSKSSHLKIHHQQYGNTTQHYGYQGNYSNNYNHNNYMDIIMGIHTIIIFPELEIIAAGLIIIRMVIKTIYPCLSFPIIINFQIIMLSVDI